MGVELSWLIGLERFAQIQEVRGSQGGRQGLLEGRDRRVRLLPDDLVVSQPFAFFFLADRASPSSTQEPAQYVLNRLRVGQVLAFTNDSSV